VEELAPYNLEPKGYYLVIARPEPEISILVMVTAYSRRPRTFPLVILIGENPDQVSTRT
jgi:hypothetical protein